MTRLDWQKNPIQACFLQNQPGELLMSRQISMQPRVSCRDKPVLKLEHNNQLELDKSLNTCRTCPVPTTMWKQGGWVMTWFYNLSLWSPGSRQKPLCCHALRRRQQSCISMRRERVCSVLRNSELWTHWKEKPNVVLFGALKQPTGREQLNVANVGLIECLVYFRGKQP